MKINDSIVYSVFAISLSTLSISSSFTLYAEARSDFVREISKLEGGFEEYYYNKAPMSDSNAPCCHLSYQEAKQQAAFRVEYPKWELMMLGIKL